MATVPDTSTFTLQNVIDVVNPLNITYPIFTGSGLNDMTRGGTFTGDTSLHYRVRVQTPLTPNDFEWSDDGGSTWDQTGVDMAVTPTNLNNGITVTFGATTGHTVGDHWDFIAYPDSLDLCFNEAETARFDPTYKGSEDRLSNFRNYGESTLTYHNTYKTGSYDYWGIATDGTYIYVAAHETGLVAYSASGTVLTQKDVDYYTVDLANHRYEDVTCGGGFIFVVCWYEHIFTYTFNGTTLTCISEKFDNEVGGPYIDSLNSIEYQASNDIIWAVGTSAEDAHALVLVYSYDHGTGVLTLLDHFHTYDTEYFDIVTDVSYAYISAGINGIRSFYWNTATNKIVFDNNKGTNCVANGIIVDENNNYLYVIANDASGVLGYTISTGDFTYNSISSSLSGGVKGDGPRNNIIYAAHGPNGLAAYKINLTTNDIIFLDSDDQGDNYKDVLVFEDVYVYTVGGFGIRTYEVT